MINPATYASQATFSHSEPYAKLELCLTHLGLLDRCRLHQKLELLSDMLAAFSCQPICAGPSQRRVNGLGQVIEDFAACIDFVLDDLGPVDI